MTASNAFCPAQTKAARTSGKSSSPYVRQIEAVDGIVIIDDSISEKPHTDENEIICWHYDHCGGCFAYLREKVGFRQLVDSCDVALYG